MIDIFIFSSIVKQFKNETIHKKYMCSREFYIDNLNSKINKTIQYYNDTNLQCNRICHYIHILQTLDIKHIYMRELNICA